MIQLISISLSRAHLAQHLVFGPYRKLSVITASRHTVECRTIDISQLITLRPSLSMIGFTRFEVLCVHSLLNVAVYNLWTLVTSLGLNTLCAAEVLVWVRSHCVATVRFNTILPSELFVWNPGRTNKLCQLATSGDLSNAKLSFAREKAKKKAKRQKTRSLCVWCACVWLYIWPVSVV